MLLKINRLLPIYISIVTLKFKVDIQSQVKFESRNQKIKYGRRAAILKVMLLKINRLLPMATINMHMKFEIEIQNETWLMLRKPCCLQTDGRRDGQMDGQGESSESSKPDFIGRVYNNNNNNNNRHIIINLNWAKTGHMQI